MNAIPINAIRQFCFCPRIYYFEWVVGVRVRRPKWTEQGQSYHDKQARLSRSRTLRRYGGGSGRMVFEQPVRCVSHGFHGNFDAALIEEKRISIIEFKLSCDRIYRGQKQQLAAYAMAASETYERYSEKAFILHGSKGDTKDIVITQQLKDATLLTVEAMRKVWQDQIMPNTSATEHQCAQCEFINYCNDRNI
tara:strand:- start:1147 stop:1725 length:579 start_codon:yes stop_codon:yes gene_type:complete